MRAALRAALVLGLLYFLVRKAHPTTLLEELKAANWGLIALAAALNLTLNALGRTLRLSLLLGASSPTRPRVPEGELAAVIFATRTINLVLPARLGEAYKLGYLRRRYGYAPVPVAAALAMEFVIEVIALGLLAPLGCLALGSGPGGKLRIFAAGSALGLGAAVALRRWARARGLGIALSGLSEPRVLLQGLALTVFADIVDLATIGLCLHAVGIRAGPAVYALILLAVNLAIALPISPGNLGTLEAGAVAALSMVHLGGGAALPFALLYHAVQTLPVAAAGLVVLQAGPRKLDFGALGASSNRH